MVVGVPKATQSMYGSFYDFWSSSGLLAPGAFCVVSLCRPPGVPLGNGLMMAWRADRHILSTCFCSYYRRYNDECHVCRKHEPSPENQCSKKWQ
jgi:hypothetical protein